MRNSGFTLIELLISMALLGIVLGIVLAAQNAVVTSSQQQQSSAGRLGVLTDITGYIGDRVRSAALVPDGLTVNGTPCLLAPTTGLPCLAVVLPMMFSKLKALVRGGGWSTLDTLIDAIGRALQAVTPFDTFGWFKHAHPHMFL